MNAVQEMIDEHKDEMPTALAKKLLDACKAERDAQPLYQLTWTMVNSHAHVVTPEDEPDFAEVELSHKTQTLIVRAVDERPDCGNGGKISTMDMPHRGMVISSWIEKPTPFVIEPRTIFARKDKMVIVHSITPFDKRQRAA